MLALQPPRMSEVDYLAGEHDGQPRHEFVDGYAYAMTGTSQRHNRIALNLASRLLAHLHGRPCQVHIADIKVHVRRAKAYYYPDIVVACREQGPAVAGASDVVDAPTLVVEVLSPTTEATDRREKLHAYRRLASLQEYALISQDRHQVEVFRRASDTAWLRLLYEPGDDLELTSVGLRVPMASLYEGTDAPVVPREDDGE